MNPLAVKIADTLLRKYHMSESLDYEYAPMEEIAAVVAAVIAEHEKGQEMKGPLCVHCGKPSVEHDNARDNHMFTPAIEPEYRLLEKHEIVQEGDEYWSPVNEKWMPSGNAGYLASDSTMQFTYRRKTTPIQPLLDNPHLGR